MRHHHDHRQLSRTAEHRRALMRALVTALFEHERIETTVAKAKEARRVAERMITYAKRNNIHSRRLVARVVQNEDVAKKLFETIAPWYTAREGGYTRVLKTRRRLGDAGEMALLELVKTEQQKEADRKRRAEKAAAAAAASEKKKKEKEKAEETEAAKEPKAEKKTEAKPKAEKKAEAKPKAERKAEAKPKAKKTAGEAKTSKPAKGKKGGLLGRLKKKDSGGESGKADSDA